MWRRARRRNVARQRKRQHRAAGDAGIGSIMKWRYIAINIIAQRSLARRGGGDVVIARIALNMLAAGGGSAKASINGVYQRSVIIS
jgi:hypothetical protein